MLTNTSPATRKRAESASIKTVDTDKDLVAVSDYIVSIVPPRDAAATAQRIITALQSETRQYPSHPLYYLDLNAISPSSARAIDHAFRENAPTVRFVDGGIIGNPPKLKEGTDGSKADDIANWTRPSIPISGPHLLPDAPVSGIKFATVLNTKLIAASIGTASGLKCSFATLTKGFTALAIQSYSTASRLGVLDHLQAEIENFNPALRKRAEVGMVGMCPKAYRWVDEMREIRKCHAEEGGWEEEAGIFGEVADVFEFVANETVLGEEKVGERKRGTSAEDVAAVMAESLGNDKMKK